MKVLLRSERTGLYVGQHTPWVADSQYAAAFSTLELAAWKARKFGRDDVVVVLRVRATEVRAGAESGLLRDRSTYRAQNGEECFCGNGEQPME